MVQKTAKVAIGRFQPPTRAHEDLINQVMEGQFSSDPNRAADPFVFTTPSQDSTHNPLEFDKKLFFLHSMFPEVPFYSCTDAFDALRKLNHWGYKRIYLYAGGDRTGKYSEFLKYVGFNHELNNVREMYIVDIGERDPDSFDVEMKAVSASRARYEVSRGDFIAFKQLLPENTDYQVMKELYNSVRVGMGLSWQHLI